MKYSIYIWMLCTLLLPLAEVAAADATAGMDAWQIDDPNDAMADMMQLLNQETELATRSKLNADYVPGMVSVLYGKDLEAMGFQIVWEALSVVPGVTTIGNAVNEFGVSVRGVAPVFGTGKLLYLINGRHSEATLRGTGPASTLRLALVDRIEVIRGPGSSVYGGYAYNGVINIILKKGNSLSLRSTNQGNHSGEWLLDTGDEGELKANLSLAGKSFRGSGTRSGTDLMYQLGNAANSHAPGIINDRVKYGTLNMDASWRGYDVHAFYNQSNNGDFFGINNTLSAPGYGGHFDFRDADFYVERHWQGDGQKGFIRLGHKRNNMLEVTPIMPTGFTTLATLPVLGPTVVRYPDGMVQQIHYSENRESLEAEWNVNWLSSHHLLLGASARFSRAYDLFFRTNYDLTTRLPFNAATFIASGGTTIVPLGWQVNTGTRNWLKEGVNRNEQALYIQDEWTINDQLTITSGLRYDHFSDVGGNFSPRLAVVFSLNDRHIFKAQFATAFRPPTFLELYVTSNVGFLKGNPNLKPEESSNIDLAYIFKSPSLTVRSSLYYSKMRNLIISDLSNRYSNLGRANRKGAELEYQWFPADNLHLGGNIGYALTRDETTNREVVATSRWLANAMASVDITHDLQCHVLAQYVGKRARQAGDPRPAAPSTMLWNTTFGYDNLWLPGLTANIGVRNLFNRNSYYPSMMTQHPTTGAAIQTYPGDYLRPGREAWLQLRYSM